MRAFTIAVASALALAAAVHANYDYGEALWKSLLFYQAQRSGRLHGMHPLVAWRRDSALGDRGQRGEDLTGGYYDAGDLVKFNFPMAYTITVLSWGVIDYEEGYAKVGWLAEALNAIKWGTDYFLKAHVAPFELYGQVGNGTLDHADWERPEDMTEARPAFKIDARHPGTDLAAETAAALAAASLPFRRAGDAQYADTLLAHAKTLYAFADTHRGKYSDAITDADAYYKSHDFTDELVWGAIWIYRASNDKYLTLAEQYYNEFNIQNGTGFGWNDKSLGATAMLLKLTKGSTYRSVLQNFCDHLVHNQQKTPKGLAFFSEWGNLRYSLNVVYICLQAADEGVNAGVYRAFAKTQLDYALGAAGRSFVGGFGRDPPTHIHHRAATCPDAPAPCDWSTYYGAQPNAHVLYGALVGGPGANDAYEDLRTDPMHNEPACDYNAAYQGVLAAFTAHGY